MTQEEMNGFPLSEMKFLDELPPGSNWCVIDGMLIVVHPDEHPKVYNRVTGEFENLEFVWPKETT